MAFDKIVGQERAIALLKNLLKTNRIPHAFLIEGLKGAGKKRIALELAKGICCDSRIERPCGSCASCIKAGHQSHPDIRLIEEDSSLKVDVIRDMQKEIQFKPYEGSRKVIIINSAEKMTIQAQNALLKTLEEPPAYATIILLANNGAGLLPTILSRCQLIKLVPAGKEVIQSYLQTEKGLSSEEARIIAAYSNGNIGRALKLQSDEEFREKRNTIIGLTRQLLDGKISELLERVGFFNDEKDSIEDIFDIFVCWYRDLLIFRETQQFDFIMNCDKIEEIRQQSKTINSHKAREIILIIEKNKSNMRSNVNFQLNIEVMLLNIQEVLAW